MKHSKWTRATCILLATLHFFVMVPSASCHFKLMVFLSCIGTCRGCLHGVFEWSCDDKAMPELGSWKWSSGFGLHLIDWIRNSGKRILLHVHFEALFRLYRVPSTSLHFFPTFCTFLRKSSIIFAGFFFSRFCTHFGAFFHPHSTCSILRQAGFVVVQVSSSLLSSFLASKFILKH